MPESLTSWLQDRIRESGLSRAEICRRTQKHGNSGVTESQLSRFLDDDPTTRRTITLATADKILSVLDTIWERREEEYRKRYEVLREKEDDLNRRLRHLIKLHNDLEDVQEALSTLGDFVDDIQDALTMQREDECSLEPP